MNLSKWLKPLAALLAKLEQRLRVTSKVAAGAAAASLGTAAVATSADAQATGAPPRPPFSSPTDTVRRYGERFILSPTDSVVIRADTTWYPRAQRGGAIVGADSTPVRVRPAAPSAGERPTARPRTGGSAGGHRSHVSHRSHSSHRS